MRLAEDGERAEVHRDPMPMRRLLLVDDHLMLTEALAVRLQEASDLWVAGRCAASDPRLPDIARRLRPDVITIDVVEGGETALRMLLFHIAVYGPKLRADAAKLARAEGASLVVCGHSHVPFIGVDRGLSIFNPGSIGPRRFHLPIVFGVIDVTTARIAMQHVDCETGMRWEP